MDALQTAYGEFAGENDENSDSTPTHNARVFSLETGVENFRSSPENIAGGIEEMENKYYARDFLMEETSNHGSPSGQETEKVEHYGGEVPRNEMHEKGETGKEYLLRKRKELSDLPNSTDFGPEMAGKTPRDTAMQENSNLGSSRGVDTENIEYDGAEDTEKEVVQEVEEAGEEL